MRFILMAMMVVLLSCKTQKIETDLKYKADIEQKKEVENSTIASDKGEIKTDKKEDRKEDVNEVINSTAIELSKPDSLGKQYATKIINTNIKKEAKSAVKSSDNSIQRNNLNIKQNNRESNELTDNSKLKDGSETEDTTNNWLYFAVSLIICGVFALIFYLTKRFTII